MKHPAMRASNRCARHNGSSGGRPKVDIALAAAGVMTLLVSHLQQSDKLSELTRPAVPVPPPVRDSRPYDRGLLTIVFF